jgi:hypothetical protein
MAGGDIGGRLGEGGAFAVFGWAIFAHAMDAYAATEGGEMFSKAASQSSTGAGHECHFAFQKPICHAECSY